MDRRPFDNMAWDRALTPHFTHQPAWTRVAIKPQCPTSKLDTIMTRVSVLTERAQASAAASAIASRQLPSWPGAQAFFQNFAQDPREKQDKPFKRARDDTFLPSDEIHQTNGDKPDTAAFMINRQCQALADVANSYLHNAEEHLYPLYESLLDKSYQAPTLGKRRRDMDHSDLDIQRNVFRTVCNVMAPVQMARRDNLEKITAKAAAIAYQSYTIDAGNSRFELKLNGTPALSDVLEQSEKASTIDVDTRSEKMSTICLDTRSDPDIFAAAPIAQSPMVTRHVTIPQSPNEITAPLAQSSTESTPSPIAQSPVEVRPASPLDSKTECLPPAAISLLAEAAGHRLDGHATNVVVEEGIGKDGLNKVFVRFKMSAEYAPLFPRGKALESYPEAVPQPVLEHVPEVCTPTPPEPVAASPISKASTADSPLTVLTSTPVIYEDDESPSREYMRGFIQRSKRAAENNVSPTRPALAPRSPNQASPQKVASPEKPATPEKENRSPKKNVSPKKGGTPTRRSSRLTNKAPKSSIPTPIRIDSRSGAGRAKAVAPDVAQTTRANTRKNKGRAQYPAEVLAAMEEKGMEISPPRSLTTTSSSSKGGKTVQWKTPVEESAPKRVTRSRAKKIAAARA